MLALGLAALECGTLHAETRISGPGDYRFSLTQGSETRQYLVHVPPAWRPRQPLPLVFSLHGGAGNMNLQANDRYYGQITQSDRLGYVAVFPNGYSRLRSGKLATWNAGACCGAARDEGIDDVAFVRAIVQAVQAQTPIDASKVFAQGMSNGGMMAHRLACDAADVFTAVASVAGTDNTTSCKPSRPVSVLHIHARDDERVLFEGGAGQQRRAVTDFTSVPETLSRWVQRDACTGKPQRTLDVPGAYCEAYTNCQGGSRVQLCVTETGGHSWPGGHKVLGGEAGSTALSANDVIAGFFFGR